jgi:hypothetical protein
MRIGAAIDQQKMKAANTQKKAEKKATMEMEQQHQFRLADPPQ